MPNWVSSLFCLSLSLALLSADATLLSRRRLLHQPFFPLDSLPPAEPPLPDSHPKYPFSDSPPSPPTDSPFFPASPPPPSPVAFASFPANISSLILPHTPSPKHASTKLVALSIAAVVSALAVLAVAVFFFYYRRKTRSDISDDKTFRSENSSRLFPAIGSNAGTRAQKLRAGSSASSEFLYLGTLVDSRRIEEGARSSRSESRKMESPELHPLPPLLRQSLGLSGGADNGVAGAAVTSTADEEDEEFYSPRGSLGTGSGSRRVLAAAAGESFRGRTSSASSSCSCSRSPSPDSLSPKRPESNTMLPVSSNLRCHPSPPTETNLESSPARSCAASSSTERVEDKSSASSSPKIASEVSAHVHNLRSSSPISSPKIVLSSVDSSPERASEIPVHRLSDVPGRVQYVRSPLLSPIGSSPERTLSAGNKLSSGSSSPEMIAMMKNLDRLRSSSPSLSASPEGSPARGSNASANHELFPSQERDFERNSGESSSISSGSVELFDFNLHRLSPSSSSSPDRVTEKEPDSSPRVSDASESYRKRHSPSPSLSSPDIAVPAIATELLPSERDSLKNDDKYSGISDASEGALFELDPKKVCSEREFNNRSDASARSPINAVQSAVSPTRTSTVPIPPPPPPPPLSLRLWEAPSPSLLKPPALVPPTPFVLHCPTNVSISPVESPDDAQKPKLKPLHWDKVRASSDREMVWDQLGSSSFKLNEEMIETLFVVKTPISKPKETTPRSVLPSPSSENRVLDPKKSQNIAISLRALSVTIEEICEALLEGNADALGNELLESLLKMAPTKEEERKLKEYKDDSPAKLGPAERFLKAVLEVPNAFKRVDAMLYIANFESELDYLKKSFQTLEGACEELRNSRMFFKLLEAVLKTGNRMNVGTNRGDARAFKLDTLLKLVDVKGADGKTTLLHFVVQEIIRTEGARYSNENDDAKCRRLGLQVVSGLSSELAEVKKAAAMDSDVLANDVAKLSRGIANITEVVRLNEDETYGKFAESMDMFVKMAEEEILQVRALESVALSLVKEITEYFHGNSTKEEAHPFRIFLVVRDFLAILDRVCKEVGMINERTTVSSAHRFPVPMNPLMAQVLPVPPVNRPDASSDDDL